MNPFGGERLTARQCTYDTIAGPAVAVGRIDGGEYTFRFHDVGDVVVRVTNYSEARDAVLGYPRPDWATWHPDAQALRAAAVRVLAIRDARNLPKWYYAVRKVPRASDPLLPPGYDRPWELVGPVAVHGDYGLATWRAPVHVVEPPTEFEFTCEIYSRHAPIAP